MSLEPKTIKYITKLRIARDGAKKVNRLDFTQRKGSGDFPRQLTNSENG